MVRRDLQRRQAECGSCDPEAESTGALSGAALGGSINIEDIEDIEDIGKPTGGFVEPAPAGFLLPGVRTRII